MKNEEKPASAGKKRPAKPEKKDKTLVTLYILAGILALGLVVFGIVMAVRAIYNAYLDSGDKYRNDVILESDHFSVNAMMLSYRYHENIYSGLYGGDYTDPEKMKQTESQTAGVSMYKYYEQLLIESLMRTLRYAEKAAENGLTLDEKDNAAIEQKLLSIENAAKNRGLTAEEYLFAYYGRGMKLSDVEDLLRLERTADKQLTAYEISVKVSDAQIDAYLTDSILRRYMRVDYFILDFGNDVADEDAAEVKAAKKAQAVVRANQVKALGANVPAETFLAVMRTLLLQEAESVSATPEETVEEWLENGWFPERTMTLPDSPPDITKWLLSEERNTGDLAVDETVVYYIFRAPYSVDTPNDAYLVIDVDKDNYESVSAALDALNGIEEEFLSGEQTEGSFRRLARTRAENAVLANKEGYFDNTANLLSSSSAFAILLADWKSAQEQNGEALQPGTVGKVYGEKELYYIYYLGKGDLRSRVEAREALIDTACRNLYFALAEEDKVVFNKKDVETRSAELLSED